jgi:hypothetical protein
MKLILDPSIQTPLDKYKDLFKFFKFNTRPINKQSINFINNDVDPPRIKELVFKDGIQQPEEKRFYDKKRLVAPIYICTPNLGGIKLKATISEEIPSTKVDKYDMIRYKNRFEFKFGGWRADFTFVIKSSSIPSKEVMQATRDKLFVGINSDNIFEDKETIWDFVDAIEVEFEYMSSLALSNDAISTVTNLLSRFTNPYMRPDILQILIKLLRVKNDQNTLKKILPNAIEINKRQYFELILKNIQDFFLTDKGDGIRTILMIDDRNITMYNTDYRYLRQNDIFPQGRTIIECEMINDKFYAYDIIQYSGKNILQRPFSARLILLESLAGIWDKLLIKKFIRLTSDNYKQTIRDFLETNRGYDTDGIMFTSANDNYMNTKFYKWKPVELMTIDFLAKRCPSSLIGMAPYLSKEGYDLYLLFVGIYEKEFNSLGLEKIRDYRYIFPSYERGYEKTYFPIQFAPSDNPMAYMFMHPTSSESMDNKVIELRYTSAGWELLRIRADRDHDLINKNYYGNNFKVAELIWRNYSNPLTIDLLCADIDSFDDEIYFKVDKSSLHNNIRMFNNMVKRELIDNVTSKILTPKNSWTIDIGCGKGQDLNKYMGNHKVRNLVMIDNNENNLCSVIKRKYEYKDPTPTNIYIKNLDLNSDWEANIAALTSTNPTFNINKTRLIICNFAIHYFTYNDNIDNFINFIDALLPPKSRFMFTCLNGKKVFDLLTPEHVSTIWGDGDKYLIKPNFTNLIFRGGEEIEILLPFSNGKLYKESLVNLDLIQKKLKKKKITLESSGNFASQEFIDKYLQLYKHELADMDLTYLQLIEYAIYYRE